MRFPLLALGELRTAARFATTDLLAFDLARIAGDEARLAQGGSQRFIVRHERASDAVANRSCLTRDSAAHDVRVDIELPAELHRAEGLLHDHTAGFSAEELIEGPAIDRDLARALAQVNPCARSLAAAGAVEGIGGCICH